MFIKGREDSFKDPTTFIKVFIGITIMAAFAVALFPGTLDALLNFSAIDGFTFKAFFNQNGIAYLIVSVALLIGIMTLIGFRLFGKSKR